MEANINSFISGAADTGLLGFGGVPRVVKRPPRGTARSSKVKALSGGDPVDGLEMFRQLRNNGTLTFADLPILETGLSPNPVIDTNFSGLCP